MIDKMPRDPATDLLLVLAVLCVIVLCWLGLEWWLGDKYGPAIMDDEPICPDCRTRHVILGYCPARMLQSEADAAAGHVRPAADVFAELRKKHGGA